MEGSTREAPRPHSFKFNCKHQTFQSRTVTMGSEDPGFSLIGSEDTGFSLIGCLDVPLSYLQP